METLKNLNKLLRTSALLPLTTTVTDRVYNNNDVVVGDEKEEKEIEAEEDKESFFELELVMLDNKTRDIENDGLRQNNANEVCSSPVSILKSATKFKVSLFRKHNNNNNNNNSSDLKLKQSSKVDDEEKEKDLSASTISTLIKESSRSNSPVSKQQSTSKHKTENDDSVPTNSSSSNRFSKNVIMHKYLKLKLIKPFHLKASKRSTTANNNNKSTSSSRSRLFEFKHSASSSSSPAPTSSTSSLTGLRVVCKQLGKSRSASSMTACNNRRDEWLAVEHDDGGIQSAILHCKRSFNSLRDSSVHSRSSSDSNSREQEEIH